MPLSGDEFAVFEGRAFAIALYGAGQRDQHGVACQRIYQDVRDRWGSRFILRNDNGRVRKITTMAVGKELDALGPRNSSAAKRPPIVAISHYSDPQCREIPIYFGMVYSDQEGEIDIRLWLPLARDPLGQARDLLPMLKEWMREFPLLSGTASPAFLCHFNVKSHARIHDEEIRRTRACLPEYQYFVEPAAGHHDGMLNWGLVNMIGPSLVSRLGGELALREKLPQGFTCESVGNSALIVASSHDCGGPEGSLRAEDRAAYQKLAEFLTPCRSTIYETGHRPTEEWDRMKVAWDSR